MSKKHWNTAGDTNRGNDWHNYLMEGCDGEEILRKEKHKDRRKNKRKRDKGKPNLRLERVYNGHIGTWCYEQPKE